MGTSSLVNEIKKSAATVFRRAWIRRRDASTGLFEASWQDISQDVKKWGTIQRSADAVRPHAVRIGVVTMEVDNQSGRYNPETDGASLWYGYASQQRSLVKLEVGYVHETQSTGGVWTRTEYPTDSTAFIGVLAGDVMMGAQQTVPLNAKSLLQVFQDYPAASLTYTTTGYTASEFMTAVRDATDGSNNYVFRPFFGDTTTNWSITATTIVYSYLDSVGAANVRGKTVGGGMQLLAEAEQFVVYVSPTGTFRFQSDAATTTVAFGFVGRGGVDSTHGHTIKQVTSYGLALSRYYSRVRVQFSEDDTTTSFEITQSAFQVGGTNNPWNLGLRTLDVTNFLIPNTATAQSIAAAIFANVSSIKNEIQFTTTLIP